MLKKILLLGMSFLLCGFVVFISIFFYLLFRIEVLSFDVAAFSSIVVMLYLISFFVFYYRQTWLQVFHASNIRLVDIRNLIPHLFDYDVKLMKLAWEPGDITNADMLILLCLLVKATNAKKIFEIGTFRGRTTLNLALNMRRDGRIYTLDVSSQDFMTKDVDCTILSKIIRISCNSKSFDFTPSFNNMDIVFVDGGHTMDVIENDTKNAFKMIREKGIIVWDDYGRTFPDVKSFLDSLSFTKRLFRDKRTGLVLYSPNW